MNLSSKHNIFLIGIGGIGMSGLAKYFIEKNKNVFGYDREKSIITIDLTKMGAKIDYNLENIILHKYFSPLQASNMEGTS